MTVTDPREVPEMKDAGEGVTTPRVSFKTMSLVAKTSLLGYFLFVMASEILVATGRFDVGLGLHILFLFLLIIHASIIAQSDVVLSRLLIAMTLIPILRILSLAIPLWPFTTVQWYAIISVPLLVACIATIVVLKLPPRDVGLSVSPVRRLPLQVLVGLVGIPLGIVEFYILHPSPWLSDFDSANLTMALFGLIAATGIAEELIFRGILQKCAKDLVGVTGIFYISAMFASLHVLFLSPADIIFVFLVALFFAFIVHKTKMIVGVVTAHTLVNVMLYLVLPSML